jgi:hypothetical protein
MLVLAKIEENGLYLMRKVIKLKIAILTQFLPLAINDDWSKCSLSKKLRSDYL